MSSDFSGEFRYMFQRLLNPLQQRSFFLFGARGTGKTTLLRNLFLPFDPIWIDLLDPTWERVLLRKPEALSEHITQNKKKSDTTWVVIDEIQKLPRLLDIVHREIFASRAQFALTGSSARKLKRGAANLLAGRAFTFSLFPLTFLELGDEFNLDLVLQYGSLPDALTLKDSLGRTRYLNSYCETYLKEEIFAEQLARHLAPFRAFLEIAASDNGHILNFEKIARDVGVDGKTIRSYYEVISDTCLGFFLDPATLSLRKKQTAKPKFYLFDTGVSHTLSGTLDIPLRHGTNFYGDAFEHFIILEIYRLNAYFEKNFRLSYLSSSDGLEIDVVLEKARRSPIFIEIISTNFVQDHHLKALKAVHKDFSEAKKICLSQDPISRLQDGIEIFPWKEGLQRLFT